MNIKTPLLVLGLSMLALPLVAGPAQEAELDSLLKLKNAGTAAQPQTSTGENGITQTIDGQYLVVSKGDMSIRMPTAYGLDNLQAIIAMLEDGLNPQLLGGKWEAVADDGTPDENAAYSSFEFDGTAFIVVKGPNPDTVQDDPLVYTGAFHIQDKEILLGDFGVMRGITITQGQDEMEFYFSAAPAGAETYEETAVKVKKVPNIESDQTDMLCKTWRLVKRNGSATLDTQYADMILFTKAGTYLVTYPDQTLGLAQWQWADDGETRFEYSWDTNWEEAGLVQIHELTPASFVAEDKAAVLYEFIPVN